MRPKPLVTLAAYSFIGVGLLAWAAAYVSASAPPALNARPEAVEAELAATGQLVALLPAAQLQDTACVDCHKNAERLQQLAEAPEEKVKLSEGSG